MLSTILQMVLDNKDIVGGAVGASLINEAIRMSKLQSNSIPHLIINIIKTGYKVVLNISAMSDYKDLQIQVKALKDAIEKPQEGK